MLHDIDRIKMMIKKLMIEVVNGRVENDWDEEFIISVKNRIDSDSPLTEKQNKKLEEIFNKW